VGGSSRLGRFCRDDFDLADPEGTIPTNGTILDGALIDSVLPRPSARAAAIALDIGLVALGVGLMTIASQVSIPWHPVPLTGGTFGALLIGGLYGLRRAFITLAIYLGIGAAGLGVFASWNGGWDYVTGATGGYLVGYLVCAVLVGFFAERGASRNVMTMLGVMVVGNAAIYAFGATWLARWSPAPRARIRPSAGAWPTGSASSPSCRATS
jgi:biotin transport system substrate-specific component